MTSSEMRKLMETVNNTLPKSDNSLLNLLEDVHTALCHPSLNESTDDLSSLGTDYGRILFLHDQTSDEASERTSEISLSTAKRR